VPATEKIYLALIAFGIILTLAWIGLLIWGLFTLLHVL